MGKLTLTYELEHTDEFLKLDRERRSIHLSFQRDDQEAFRKKVEDYAARITALSASTPYLDEVHTVSRWWIDLETKYHERCGYESEIQVTTTKHTVIPNSEKRDRIRNLLEGEVQDNQLDGILKAVEDTINS